MEKATKKATAMLAMILAISYGISLATTGVSVPQCPGCGGGIQ